MRNVILAFSTAMLASACMASPMDHGNQQMSEALASARNETSHHADVCSHAATLTDVTGELQRHEDAMDALMDRMDGAMGDMHGMHCSGGHMDSMMGTLSDIRTRVGDHATRLGAAGDVTKAHDECARYRDDMLGLCAAAGQDNDAMDCM